MHEKALDFLRNWAVPAVVVLVTATSTGTATWIATRQEIRTLEKQVDAMDSALHKLQELVADKHAVGPDGFLDPVLHSRVDRHIEHWVEDKLGRAGWRDMQRDYENRSSNGKAVSK